MENNKLPKDKNFGLCDRKNGACSGWKKGWTKCEGYPCSHTSNHEHWLCMGCKDGYKEPMTCVGCKWRFDKKE